MQAAMEDQQRLLELQVLDSAIARLRRRRASLPEAARVVELQAMIAALDQEAGEREAALAVLRPEQRRLETDLERVSTKRAAEQAKVASGAVTNARELRAITEEVEALARRQSALEDQVLERLEVREALEAEMETFAVRGAALRETHAVAVAARDRALAEVDQEIGLQLQARERVAPTVPAVLLGLYEQVRAREGGIGAAALVGGACQGCHMAISPVELRALHQLPPEDVKRCEQCRRILVVT